MTVIHLVRRTERKGPNTRELINLGVNKPKGTSSMDPVIGRNLHICNGSFLLERLHAFCRDCEGLVPARPIFICRECKAVSFPIASFEQDYPSASPPRRESLRETLQLP